MEWLNYHHLFYFWTVVREGGISRAAAKLRLSQPTVSAQVKLLERSLGEPLFQRKGRTLVLTDVGRIVDRYADDIFTTGRELLETLKGQPSGRAPQLTVGVADAVPKLVVRLLLRPVTEGTNAVRVTCREGHPDHLVAQLATHELDVVISDTPAAPHVRVRVFSHLLGESGTSFFAGAGLARRLRRRFPKALNGAPILLPTSDTALRRSLEALGSRRRTCGPWSWASSTIRRCSTSLVRWAWRISGPDRHRAGSLPELRPGRRRANGGRPGALLRDIRRATAQASWRGGHHQRRAHCSS